ncbi:CoA pyrophosphatase [Poseidonocella sedimentorum]|uniref:8-oxo-dGTP pyrophosphatase MutT, NUDIX family n=1 Tax=Poseidonocella sedimentorum TaxID=871652 RepID=A0A1I6D5W9_9RHOB|nr:CoA pyrophosphatase [Poseidonocella sedimentorum]SFR00820.1 8-oxo-dGTP pyrophosphatase MutT, NUDIX family [Poseidonocella sedimentorum]
MPRRKADPLAALGTALTRPGAASSDFDLNPGIYPQGRKLRPAAVLVPFFDDGSGTRLILTKRASGLKHHPGQIAFPGGKMDPEDATLEDTALREAREEIGLDPANVTILGRLSTHETVSSFTMTPVLARLNAPFAPVAEPGEVEEVFTVPFDHVTDPARFRIEHRYWRGERRYYYTVPYGPYYIWGATARILRGLADRVTGEG